MKHKSFLAALLLIFCATSLWASNTSVDGIWYDFDNQNLTAIVTYRGSYASSYSNEYQGSVIIPSSVTYNSKNYDVISIGAGAFSNCTELTSISIPSSVTSVGKEAFMKCTGISHISLPDNIISIGEGAFQLCKNLTSVILPNGITTIEKSTFSSCTNLSNITIPNSVVSIGEHAFSGCAITSPNIISFSVITIGNAAFSSCEGLSTINIPSNVTTIGNQAFYACSNLNTVNISDGVSKIEDMAFLNCSNLTSVNIPNSVTEVGKNIFSGCGRLTSPIYNSHTFVYLPTSYSGDYSIPQDINSISGGAFKNCTNLKSVSIPNSVIIIGEGSFYGCNNLSTITIPEGVTSIEYQTFYNCDKMATIEISDNIESIGRYAFGNCQDLISITIPQKCTNIEKDAFYGCTNLTSIIWNAKNCNTYNMGSHVTSFTFGDAVEIIPDNLCQNMNLLTFVTIPGSVTSIGNKAFYNCSSLEHIILFPDTPPTIGEDIVDPILPVYVPCGTLEVYQMSNWANYNIQYQSNEYKLEATSEDSIKGYVIIENNLCTSSVTAIPNLGYYFVQWSDGNTENPRTLVLNKNISLVAEFEIAKSGTCGKNDQLSWAYDDKTKTLMIEGPGELTENYTYGIEAPTQMQNLFIDNYVTSIGDSAFYAMTTIRHLSIGSGITSIGNYAFAECKNFDDITCYATTVPTITSTTFANVGNKYYIYLFVPEDCQRAYKRDTYWCGFDIKPLIEATGVETNDIIVTPSDSSAVVAWPAISEATTYELVIKDKDGNIICTLIFNAQGRLVQISFKVPALNNDSQKSQTNGFSFVITGLEENTTYDLVITAKDINNNTIEEKTISFKTTGGTQSIENVKNDSPVIKILDSNNVYIIMPDGKKYTIIGNPIE